MARHPHRRRRRHDPDAPVVDLADVFADDALVDRLIDNRTEPRRPGPPDPLVDLLSGWRAELEREPLPPVPNVPASAVAGTVPGLHRRRSSLRPAMGIVAAISALLVASAVVGARDAQPGDPLFPLTQAMWPDRVAADNALRVAAGAETAVRQAVDEAASAIGVGHLGDAAAALQRAEAGLGAVTVPNREELRLRITNLWAKLGASSTVDEPAAPAPSTAPVEIRAAPLLVEPQSRPTPRDSWQAESPPAQPSAVPPSQAAEAESGPGPGVAATAPPAEPSPAPADPTTSESTVESPTSAPETSTSETADPTTGSESPPASPTTESATTSSAPAESTTSVAPSNSTPSSGARASSTTSSSTAAGTPATP